MLVQPTAESNFTRTFANHHGLGEKGLWVGPDGALHIVSYPHFENAVLACHRSDYKDLIASELSYGNR